MELSHVLGLKIHIIEWVSETAIAQPVGDPQDYGQVFMRIEY